MKTLIGVVVLQLCMHTLLSGQVLRIPATPGVDYKVIVSGAIYVNTDPTGPDPIAGVTMFAGDNREDGSSCLQRTLYGTPSPYESKPDTVTFRNVGDYLFFFAVGENSADAPGYNGSYQISVNGTNYELTTSNIVWMDQAADLKIPATPGVDYKVIVSGAIYVNTDPTGPDPIAGVTMFAGDNREDGSSCLQRTLYGTPSPYESKPDTVTFRNVGDYLFFFAVGENSADAPGYNGSYQISVNGTNYELTTSNIVWMDNPTTGGLAAYYPFSGNANDASGNGNHGTVSGATPTSDRDGTGNRAYSFSSNAEITLPNTFAFSTMTFCAWIYTTRAGESATIFTEHQDETHCLVLNQTWTSDNIGLWMRNGEIAFEWELNSGTNTAHLNQWNYVCFVLNGTIDSALLYVNGSRCAQTKMKGYTPANLTAVSNTAIGNAYYNPADYFEGKIDDVRIYNRALTDTEIKILSITSVEEQHDATMPRGFALFQNYPNPFNPTMSIQYALPRRSEVTLTVCNTLGQQVAILQNGEQESGYHEVTFDAANLPSGMYFCRMQAGEFTQTRKLLLLR